MDILEKYIARGRRTASRIWGDTAVVLLLPRGNLNTEEKMFELSKTGMYIWKFLEKKPKLKEVVSYIAKKNGTDYNSAKKEVVTFVKKLAKDKIVDFLDTRDDQ